MDRISRDSMLMEVAFTIAKRSTCNRAHVGAVIAQDGRIVSTGYAGAPSGVAHCDDQNCNASAPCTRTVHAEAGAITYAAREGIKLKGSTLYCTHAPCLACARLLLNCGIIRVVYQIPYRITEGLELLRETGVDIRHLEEFVLV